MIFIEFGIFCLFLFYTTCSKDSIKTRSQSSSIWYRGVVFCCAPTNHLRSHSQHCPQLEFKLNTALYSLSLISKSFPLIFFSFFLACCLSWTDSPQSQALISNGSIAPHSCVLLSWLMNLFCRGFWVPWQWWGKTLVQVLCVISVISRHCAVFRGVCPHIHIVMAFPYRCSIFIFS